MQLHHSQRTILRQLRLPAQPASSAQPLQRDDGAAPTCSRLYFFAGPGMAPVWLVWSPAHGLSYSIGKLLFGKNSSRWRNHGAHGLIGFLSSPCRLSPGRASD
ncbi:hypothetical protein MN608_00951 [Microdochium nivale]|nr:hypothetical protein MN608_00951 [Microdochium nivale]